MESMSASPLIRSARSDVSTNSTFSVRRAPRFRRRLRSFALSLSKLVPPDVYSPIVKSFHSIGDAITFQCLIDANPEPDIRWVHRFSDDINQEMDLSRQFKQGFPTQSARRESSMWSIEQEQINATRWRTSLFIKVNARLCLSFPRQTASTALSLLAYSKTLLQLPFHLSSSEPTRSG